MKISKLFHWLYALVMLLPIFAIGSTILVNIWNKNKIETKEEVTYTNITDYTNMEVGKWYTINTNNSPFTSITSESIWLFFDDLEIVNFPVTIDTTDIASVRILQFNSNVQRYRFYFYDNETNFIRDSVVSINENNCNFNFRYLTITNNQNYSLFSQIFYETTLDNVSSVNDVFYYAVDKVTESPLFSWAYDSFLVAPFAYIVALFGMPTNSVIVQLLSYWLAISIIWLVFDLILYVPLLVHRWLDKGILE